MQKIDAVILAGGKGTRLKSVIAGIPKPLAPVNGKPFLDILLSQLDGFKCIRRVILAVGYKSDTIIARYKNCSDYDFKIVFSTEKELLGTGGGLKKALLLTKSEDVLVLNGDTYVEIDICEMIREHRNHTACVTMALKEVDNAGRYGSVRIDNQRRIVLFEEKKETSAPGLINAGMYIIKRGLFDDREENKEFSFEKESLPNLINDTVYGHVAYGKFIDIGLPQTYEIADNYLKEVAK